MRRALLIVLVAVLSAVSAGAAQAAVDAPACRAPAKWQDRSDSVVALAFRTTCQIARAVGWKAIAAEYRSARNPILACEKYAKVSYRPKYVQPGFEGCLKGLRLRGEL